MGKRDDVSDEEARLREYLERERTHGDWPEQLQREHPDLFPVHAQEEDDPADPKAVRRLLLVTGSIVVALLVAEVTDTVVGNAWLLALLVAMAGMSFYYGFLYRHHVVRYYRRSAQAGFVGLLFCLALVTYFGAREQRTIDELAALVDPIPGITDATYVPSAAELQAIEGILSAMSGSPDEAARLALPRTETADEQRYWLLKTDLEIEEAIAFYEAAGHLRGWTVDSQRAGLFLLRRGDERMFIFVRDDWPRPRTLVSYIYDPEGNGAPAR